MEDVGIFYGIYSCHLVYFPRCTKKNLATLAQTYFQSYSIGFLTPVITVSSFAARSLVKNWQLRLRSEEWRRGRGQGCHIFLGAWYRNRKNVPDEHKVYLMVIKHPICPENITDGHKIYTNILQSKAPQNLPKLGFWVWKLTIWQPWRAARSPVQSLKVTKNWFLAGTDSLA
jgi:hypothetical protein